MVRSLLANFAIIAKNEQEPEPKMSDSKPITRPSSDLLEEKAESLFDKEHEPIPNKAGMARTFALDENPHMESLAEAFDGDKVVRPERLTAFDK